MKKHQGIGLLELMLALAVIAVLIIFSVAYYSQVKRNQQMASAETQIKILFQAATDYVNTAQQTHDAITQNANLGPLLVSQGMLNNQAALANPFNLSAPSQVIISGNDVIVMVATPAGTTCTKLKTRLNTVLKPTSVCGASKGFSGLKAVMTLQ